MSRTTVYFYFVEPYLIQKVFPNTKWSGQQDLLDSTVSPKLPGGIKDQNLEKGNERGYPNGKKSCNLVDLLIFKTLQITSGRKTEFTRDPKIPVWEEELLTAHFVKPMYVWDDKFRKLLCSANKEYDAKKEIIEKHIAEMRQKKDSKKYNNNH